MLREVRRRADDFDIIHFMWTSYLKPVHDICPQMSRDTAWTLDLPMPGLYKAYPEMPLVSISNAQRRPCHIMQIGLRRSHTACDERLSVQPGWRSYLAFLGRISPEKRPDRAIEIAKRAGIR